ncbi:aldo/keto reductase [Myxococcus sp. MISCRS1]|jgi:aryl-alcohol dehydrogenase-like predicted oxidoreductase|uniref:aldo/keto reductase n=1 Tax=Myxococcus TaxID=32 RepID=UPI001CBEC744|nr:MULTISPECIES: aldo/keto reductase [unclassified Myxococcus]MBZ4395484.1 aldo/keto reductase [Myxococcus sp. AS-1-15]MCY0999162.1 aldo/keto reductase [Myxococcus sp. MISCRS1]BDT30832.1 aldo/keto reductase [Myxococcus sp. MH1]
MPLNHYVTLGRSGLRVSPLCLGAMTFGEDLGWGSSVEESQQIIDRYIELGGNFIDTANFYTKSHSEKILGDHVGRHPARRDRLVLATKFSGNLYPGDPNGGGSGRKSIIAAAENSLRRLQTDYIDLYWLHNWDIHTPIEETMAALEDLVRAGKVRYLGVSDTPAWKIAQANVMAHFRGWSSFIGLQIEYSLLERSVEQELVPMALELGLGITPWSPLKSGALSGKYTRANAGQQKGDRGAFVESYLNEKTYALVDALGVIAKEQGTSIARVALAWVQAQPGVSSTIIGARRLSQLEDNVGALEVKLSAEQLGRLDALSKPTFGFPQSMQPIFPAIHNGGTTVNGVFMEPSPFGVVKGEKPY